MRKIRVRHLCVAAAVAVGLITSACGPLGSTGPMSGPYAKTIWGPDVSNYQHPFGAAINWPAVRAQGARFAFVKMSEGNFYVNPYAVSDIAHARAAGLYVGAYHFARPRLPLTTAASDARLFASQLGNVRVAGYLPPIIDIETNGGLTAANVTAWTKSFLATLQGATGRIPMIYSGSWFWRGYMGNPSGFSQYPVWIADYEPKNIGPTLFGDFKYSSFWQYSDSAKVSGIADAVDSSWFHGTLTQLQQLAYVPTVSTAQAPARSLDTLVQPASPGSTTTSHGTTGAQMAQNPNTVGAAH
jgi:GH25 family lysozyme M1 (1,4-beta-N-acetylmuramidase)